MEHRREPGTGRSGTPPGDRFALFGIMVMAALLRFFRIGQQSYWADEIQSIWQVNGHAGTITDNILTNTHGPLHFTLLWAWSKLGGWSEAWTRSLSAAAALVTILLLYALARRLAGRRAALWAAFLMALSPFHIMYSQEVRNYALLILTAVLSYILLIRITGAPDSAGRRDPRRRAGLGMWIAFLFTSAAALACNLAAIFMFVAQGLYILIVRPKLFGKLILIIALMLVLLLPWVRNIELGWSIDHILHGDPLRTINVHPFSLPYTFMVYSIGETVGPSRNEMNRSLSLDMFTPFVLYFAAACIVYAFLILRGAGTLSGDRSTKWLFATWLLAPIVLAGLLAFLNLKVYQVRYTAVGFPAYLVLLAAGMERCGRWLRRALLAAVAVLTFVSLHNYYTDSRYWKPDARAAAAAIMDRDRAGDAIALYTIQEPLLYYYDGPAPVIALWFEPGSERFWEEIDDIGGRYERIWLVDYFGWYIDPAGQIPEIFDERFTPTDTLRLTGIEVRLYENPGRAK